MKKITALFLCTLMCLSLFPTGAFAEEIDILSDVVVTDDIEELTEPFGADSGEDDCVFVDAGDRIFSAGGYLPKPKKTLKASSGDKAGAMIALAEGMKNYAASVDVSSFNISEADVVEVFSDTLNSHPELYYVNNQFSYYRYGGYVISYELQYKDEYSHREQIYEAAVQNALSCVKEGMTELQKALVLYDYLQTHVDYDQSLSRHNSYDALVTGSAVCHGYALAYLELLSRCGVGCGVVTSISMGHAWNTVRIDGQWYHADLTWDDASNYSYQGIPGYAGHTYFLASDSGFSQLGHHDWQSGNICTSTLYDAGGFWTDCKSQIVMPDAHRAYYLLDSIKPSGIAFVITLYQRDMSTGATVGLYSLNTAWKAGEYSFWQEAFPYLSYDRGLLWLNDADNIYTYSLANGACEKVYTAPQGKQIYGFFEENSTATIALSNNPNGFSDIIRTNLGTVSQYAVTFDANGGEGVIAAQIKTAGQTLTLTDEIPERAGYIFLGWARSKTASGAEFAAGGSFDIDADTTLYAVWAAETYSVRFVDNYYITAANKFRSFKIRLYGEDEPRQPNTEENDVLLESSAYPEGLVFEITAPSKNSKGKYYSDPNVSCYSYDFTGSTVGGETLGESLPYEDMREADGTFHRWYHIDSVTGDLVVMVKLVLREYSVTVTGSGAGEIALPKTTAAYRSSFRFTRSDRAEIVSISVGGTPLVNGTGYQYINASGIADENSITVNGAYIRGNIVIDTALIPSEFTVSYDLNGGEGETAQQTVTAGETLIISSAIPNRAGYVFCGWATESGSRTVAYKSGDSVTLSADITLYAVWKIPGDVNGDGFVGTKDFLTLMRYCAGDRTMPFDPNALNIDGDSDGAVNPSDYIALMLYLAGGDMMIN